MAVRTGPTGRRCTRDGPWSAPAAPTDLRREGQGDRRRKTQTSQYRGVFWSPRSRARPWLVQIGFRQLGICCLGTWATEEEAAIAYDRAARHYRGAGAIANFPDRKVAPASAVALCAEARRAGKATKTSRYRGVCWNARWNCWTAVIGHRGRSEFLGNFKGERDAAEAYDER